MKRTFFAIAALALLLVSSLGQPPPAAAATKHTLPYNCVHQGKIRWVSVSQYSAEINYAIGQWEALGKIDFVNTWGNMVLQDQLRLDTIYAGWNSQDGTNWCTITFNTYYTTKYSLAQRRALVLHELGHGLGIGDHYEFAYSGQVMYYKMTSNPATSPQIHDKADFNSASILWELFS